MCNLFPWFSKSYLLCPRGCVGVLKEVGNPPPQFKKETYVCFMFSDIKIFVRESIFFS